MEKNNNSSTSGFVICQKVREALVNCPALRAINSRISHNHQESETVSTDSNSPSPSLPKTTPMQTKPTKPQNLKVHSQAAAEAIPIKFDYSTPISNRNGNLEEAAAAAAAKVAPPHVRNSEKVEENGKAKTETEQHGKKDMNYAFSEYIQRARGKIRVMSNVGRGQGEPATDDKASNGYGTRKKDNHEDHFSNFIHVAKKKIRTTSSIRRE